MFTSKEPGIGTISAALNEPDHLTVRAVLNIWVGELVRFFNVGKTMNESQVVETVGIVVKRFRHFKLADFKLCFENAKAGVYGPLYDRLDGALIIEWLNKYDAARDSTAAEVNYNLNQVNNLNSLKPLLPQHIDETDNSYDERFKANIQKLRQTLEDNKKAREAEKANNMVNRPVDPFYQMHQNWMRQFTQIRKRQLYLSLRVGFVKRYGRIINIDEYLEQKQWQYQLAKLTQDKRMKFYLTKYKTNDRR